MRLKTLILLALPFFLLTLMLFNSSVYAAEERKVLSRRYLGLGVDVYAPFQAYPGETITVRVRVEALEDIKNVSITMFIWSSKSEGYSPWGTSFPVIDVPDLSKDTVQETEYDAEIASDISPGLTYGILFLEWSIYLQPSWEDQWDKASFRATYVKNKDYENLQTTHNELQGKYNSVLSDMQNFRMSTYLLLTTTIGLAVSAVYLTKRKPRLKREKVPKLKRRRHK